MNVKALKGHWVLEVVGKNYKRVVECKRDRYVG